MGFLLQQLRYKAKCDHYAEGRGPDPGTQDNMTATQQF
jgi:hypothetical protein